jgi:acylpyruvate hydrolase
MIPWHAAPDATVHEVELGVIMNGLRADQAAWQDRIGGYVLLLDMGDFDMIKSAITNKHSWTISKMQDNFLILGDLIPREAIEDPHNVDLVLKINSKII